MGSVIPRPKEIGFPNGFDYLSIDPADFGLILADESVRNCRSVQRAALRYSGRLLFDDKKPEDRDQPDNGKAKKLGQLRRLEIVTKNQPGLEFLCELTPNEGMDESYSLSVEISASKDTSAHLVANTNWGLMRGLETFSQLVFNVDQGGFAIRTVKINDSPRFKYRGYMLDTARHFISVPRIFDLLDAMAYNKLNVFHWHLVDDQSFPLVSSVYPELSLKTSFRPTLVYSQNDVKRVIRYATDRGIRVLPELDTPGHTYALRFVQDLLTQCYDRKTMRPNGDFGPIDPTKASTYKSVAKLIKEMGSIFFENYFHAGGDEVDFDCWSSNPNINNWMSQHNMTANYRELEKYYIGKVYDILSSYNKTVLVWQEVFDNGSNLPKDSIVHVWKNQPAFMTEMKSVVQAGYRAILSSCWYLNYIGYGQDWVKFYRCDPASGLSDTPEEEALVLGGEVCMWTEFVDDNNVLTRTWPRASAAAERLWSPKTSSIVEEFLPRLEQMRCRLLYRGIQAEPVNGPGYC